MATNTEQGTVPGTGLPAAVVEEILGESRRKVLLRCLAETGPRNVDDLAEAVLEREAGAERSAGAGKQVPAEARERVRADLYERHLPKLTATGLVTYDSMRERVALARPAIADYLD